MKFKIHGFFISEKDQQDKPLLQFETQTDDLSHSLAMPNSFFNDNDLKESIIEE